MNDQEPQKLSEAEPKTNHIVETEPQTQLPEQEQKKQKAFMKSLRAIIGLCLLVVFFFFLFLPEIKKLFTRPADKKILTEQLQPFLEPILNKSKLPAITTSIYLKKGEEAYLQEYVTLNEPKTQTVNIRARFNITKEIRIGGTLPKYIAAITKVDEGNLILTNKRLIFNGTRNIQINLNEILSLDIFQEGISIAKEKRKKEYIFSTKKPWLWKILLHYLNTGQLLSEVKID